MKKLTILSMILITTCLAKIEKIDDNYYRITSQNIREIAQLKEERDYYKQEVEKARENSSLCPYYFTGGFILGFLIAK